MRERTDFPSTQVRSQEKHTFAARVSSVVGFISFIDSKRGNVLARIRRELAEIGKLPPQRSEYAVDYAAPLTYRHLWKCHLQITKANTPKTTVKKIDQLSEEYPARARQRARH